MATQLNLKLERNLFEDICSLPALRRAFRDVRRNKGAAGVDGVTIQDFELSLEENLRQLREDLINWRYKPLPVRRVNIPKPDGGTRKLGVPSVRDRVLQTSIKLVLEPTFDPLFSKSSFGFRPGLGQKDALEQAKQIVNTGKDWTVDIDLAAFFDEINHDRLIHRMGKFIADKRILRLIGLTLRSGIMENGITQMSQKGSVQGSPLSPLLSNIVLDELDKEMEKQGYEFCRYADDLVTFVTTPQRRGTSYEIAIHLHREETQVEGESGEKPSGFHKANEVSWNDDHSRNSCYISSFSKPSHEQGFGTYPKKQLPLHRTEH